MQTVFENGMNWVFPYELVVRNDAEKTLVLRELPRQHKGEFSTKGLSCIDIRGTRAVLENVLYDICVVEA
jgi:hypothetical protein